jgi:phospholipid N-methyltransferase
MTMTYTATYSPEDNKLRLYASSRLDSETYARVKAAGFIWAPKQELFVAPMWTPSREDLLIELAGEIDDEDTSLVDRAEDRAERFEDYKESRIEDAQRAQDAVHRIADNIPFGQPILVGHHSERHARKDAERIQNGMRKTVQMWQTARYWEERAAGALRHAKYKALPGVRHRRIKGLQADQRKQQRHIDECEKFLRLWADDCAAIKRRDGAETTFLDRARMLTGQDHVSKVFTLSEFPRPEGASTYEGMMSLYSALGDDDRPGFITPEQARDIAVRVHERSIARAQRWLNHYINRIAYEKAMLGEAGGLAASRFNLEVGGKVLIGSEWLVILKVNKTGDGITSVTTTPRQHFYGSKYKADLESIKDYQAPNPEETAAVKAATKLPPMCNYPGEGFKHMTAEEWKRKKMSDVPQSTSHAATDTHGAHRTRATYGAGFRSVSVFLTDSKRIDPPAKQAPEPTGPDTLRSMAHDLATQNPLPAPRPTPASDPRIPSHNELRQLKTTAAAVSVVAVPQLFPTPRDLAARMVSLADIQPGATVLEPSAGTGALLDAIRQDAAPSADVTAVEINMSLTTITNKARRVHYGDFLECSPADLGAFDRIIMNPPFANAADIKHITHARTMLKPGGRLVAICANGPRQNATLRPLVEACGGFWEELAPDTFRSSGTGVSTVLLTLSGDH